MADFSFAVDLRPLRACAMARWLARHAPIYDARRWKYARALGAMRSQGGDPMRWIREHPRCGLGETIQASQAMRDVDLVRLLEDLVVDASRTEEDPATVNIARGQFDDFRRSLGDGSPATRAAR